MAYQNWWADSNWWMDSDEIKWLRFSSTATDVGVGGKEGVIGRDASRARRINGREAMVERANDLAAKGKRRRKIGTIFDDKGISTIIVQRKSSKKGDGEH